MNKKLMLLTALLLNVYNPSLVAMGKKIHSSYYYYDHEIKLLNRISNRTTDMEYIKSQLEESLERQAIKPSRFALIIDLILSAPTFSFRLWQQDHWAKNILSYGVNFVLPFIVTTPLTSIDAGFKAVCMWNVLRVATVYYVGQDTYSVLKEYRLEREIFVTLEKKLKKVEREINKNRLAYNLAVECEQMGLIFYKTDQFMDINLVYNNQQNN